MYRKLAALLLAAALLCSCSARVTVQRYPAELPQVESPAATPTPEPVPTFTEEQKSYGSAALLTDATVLVNVFLNDAAHGQTWDAESRAAAVQRTQLAVDWITEQAAGYEAAVNLICDRSADGSDSTLTRSYLVQSAMQGGENSEESSAFLDEMDTLCASLAADSRLAAYGARHIAFLFFLPISGTSFTMAHYADDGDSFYYEYSCLYKTDAYTDGEAESPATYAHEILHLFGAPDLSVTRWGTLRVDGKTMMASLPGVFGAGDIVRGASLVVWAVRDGRDVPAQIHQYLRARVGAATLAA